MGAATFSARGWDSFCAFPKGPSSELIPAVVEKKLRNPNWGLSANRATNRLGVSYPNRQRRGSQDSRPSLPATTELRWPFLADFPGPHERQPLEHRSVQVRVGHVEIPLGSWRSWISIRAESLASASMRERSMVPRSVGCSIAPFEGNSGCQTTLAPTTIRSFASIKFGSRPTTPGQSGSHDDRRALDGGRSAGTG
jgi:hypothetical protein